MLAVSNLSKEFPTPLGVLPILSGVSFTLKNGEAASITGPSGSGKSTLLYILGGLEPPTAGHVSLDGRNPFELPEDELAAFRNRQIGFVFQDHYLLPQCTVLENVLTPTLVAHDEQAEEDFTARAHELLAHVGLSERVEHRPAELSGGEKQRVALARALIRQPTLLLCDEPTGSLDRKAAESVISLLLDLHQQQQTILVVVTHNLELAARLPKQFNLRDRQLHQT